MGVNALDKCNVESATLENHVVCLEKRLREEQYIGKNPFVLHCANYFKILVFSCPHFPV